MTLTQLLIIMFFYFIVIVRGVSSDTPTPDTVILEQLVQQGVMIKHFAY